METYKEMMKEFTEEHKPDEVKPKSECSDLLNANVRIGLKAQGHIPTVGKMLAEGKSWSDIGAAIGWDGETAKKWWVREISCI